MRSALHGRITVVSPHLDDAVLSLGATIARATRSGARVEVLTVFAGDPASEAPAHGWDRRGGFATEGEAMAARRVEDQKACAIVGADTSWLTFPGGKYAGVRDKSAIWSSIAAAVEAADAALVPGFPLVNEDHSWLSELLVERGLPCPLALYAEQPYRYAFRRENPVLPARVEWTKSGFGVREYRLKRRAILAYESQIPLLGLAAGRHRKLNRMLVHEVLRGGEALAWLSR